MSKDESEARERIIACTIELIEKGGGLDNITVRDIAAKSGVGVGLINYHFQTKQNLMDQCVQRIISNVIGQFETIYKSLQMKPIEKLKFLIKSTCLFLASKPGISRISILKDFNSGQAGDNSSQTASVYFPVVKEVCGNNKTDEEVRLLLHILISSLQVAFVRKDVMKEIHGIDFFNKEQREAFVDRVIDTIFREGQEYSA